MLLILQYLKLLILWQNFTVVAPDVNVVGQEDLPVRVDPVKHLEFKCDFKERQLQKTITTTTTENRNKE